MSDEHLRALERRWRESGADEDVAAWLTARLRAGALTPVAVELAAQLGYGPAIVVLGDAAPDTRPVPHGGHMPQRRLVAAAAFVAFGERVLLPRCAAGRPGDDRLRDALAAYRAWVLAGAPSGVAVAAPRVDESEDGEAGFLLEVLRRLAMVQDRPGEPSAGVEAASVAIIPVMVGGQQLLDPWVEATGGDVRREVVASFLGVDAPVGSFRELSRLRVHVGAADDLPPALVPSVVRWLDDLPGPAPRTLRFVALEDRVAWGPDLDATALRLHEARGANQRRPYLDWDTPQVIVTTRPDADGWFARHLPGSPAVACVHLDEVARAKLEAPPAAFLAHLIAKKVLDGLLRKGGLPDDDLPLHVPSRGCVFDLCGDKVSLDARIRVGSPCRECEALLRTRARAPRETLDALLRVLDAARRAVLERR